MKTIVQLDSGVWLCKGDSDPSRTLVKGNATVYPSELAAVRALRKARKYRPFLRAELQAAEAATGEQNVDRLDRIKHKPWQDDPNTHVRRDRAWLVSEVDRLREALQEAAEMTEHEADRTLIYNYCKQAVEAEEGE